MIILHVIVSNLSKTCKSAVNNVNFDKILQINELNIQVNDLRGKLWVLYLKLDQSLNQFCVVHWLVVNGELKFCSDFVNSVKPTLKKVSKYENKFAKLQKKAAEFNFKNQLKQVKKKEFTLDDEDDKKKKDDKPEWTKAKDKGAEVEAAA